MWIFTKNKLWRKNCICENLLFTLTEASREDAGSMWPLDTDQLHIINENLQQLVQVLDSGDDLIFSLIGTDCFNSRQISAIKCIPDVEGRNAKLLQMLKRRGVEHFNQFLHCLEQFQRHLLPLFTRDTGMVNLPCGNFEGWREVFTVYVASWNVGLLSFSWQLNCSDRLGLNGVRCHVRFYSLWWYANKTVTDAQICRLARQLC